MKTRYARQKTPTGPLKCCIVTRGCSAPCPVACADFQQQADRVPFCRMCWHCGHLLECHASTGMIDVPKVSDFNTFRE